jgi:[ribosomal protein S18]-alanine N-acetyltransferase
VITIVDGDGSDIAQIMPVMDAAFDARFGEAWTAAQCLSTLAMPRCGLLLANDADRTIGFALSRWVGDEEELLLIGVDPKYRREGVGKHLIIALRTKAKLLNRSSIFLEVRSGNTAENFYREMGFSSIGRRAGYYRGNDGSLHDSITMQLCVL